MRVRTNLINFSYSFLLIRILIKNTLKLKEKLVVSIRDFSRFI
jgi:hypothetical protein